jgi:thiol-disulfide isomerase/thioredoxin
MQHRGKISRNKLLILVVLSIGAILSMAVAPEGAVSYMMARAAGNMKGVEALKTSSPQELPALPFLTEETKGKVVVVNFWAMWCASCKLEKPTLDRLQADYANKGLVVLSVSDAGDDLDIVGQYYIAHNIKHLKPLKDENGASFRALGLRGVPSTLILNTQGKEIARAEGAVNWDAPAARRFIEKSLHR